MHKLALAIAFISVLSFFQLSQGTTFSGGPITQIYKTGTEFRLVASRWGLSAEGTMEILERTKFAGKDVILVRSQVTKMGGLIGSIVRFLRIYKESNTFDSYIDPQTFLSVRYEVYKLKSDGSKKLTEHVYFDREQNRIVSLKDYKTMAIGIAPDTQDAFSIFLSLLYKLNTEELFVGKHFVANLYAYEKTCEVEFEVTNLETTNGIAVYTVEIEELPPTVFKHPTSIKFKVIDTGGPFMFPVNGQCTIEIPVLPDVTIDGELSIIK